MEFKNKIQFKHGVLKRGEHCLYRGCVATYMGSYREEGSGYVHMLRLENSYTSPDYPIIEQHIIQEIDKDRITCIAQAYRPGKEQMQLC